MYPTRPEQRRRQEPNSGRPQRLSGKLNKVCEGEAPMRMEISVAEAVELINQIRKQPDSLFEMLRADVKSYVGQYLSVLMQTELSGFLGRAPYQRIEGRQNHRNGVNSNEKCTTFGKKKCTTHPVNTPCWGRVGGGSGGSIKNPPGPAARYGTRDQSAFGAMVFPIWCLRSR